MNKIILVVLILAFFPAASAYGLNVDSVVEETTLPECIGPYWCLTSGAYFYITNGVGSTVHGNLSASDNWRMEYSKTNAEDTDNGYHPQNIFRLVTKDSWVGDVRQEAYFQITADQLSESPNRAGHNGILFFSKYRDSQNLYYLGIRVDGFAVIKKKVGGKYYDIDYERVYPGLYDRDTNPNILPHNVWIGIRSIVQDTADGAVSLQFYLDKEGSGKWELATQGIDNGIGGPVFKDGWGGIRTDFMDVSVKGYDIVMLAASTPTPTPIPTLMPTPNPTPTQAPTSIPTIPVPTAIPTPTQQIATITATAIVLPTATVTATTTPTTGPTATATAVVPSSVPTQAQAKEAPGFEMLATFAVLVATAIRRHRG